MAYQSIILAGPSQKEWAIKKVQEAPVGWIVKVGEPTRTDMQNRLLHPLIRVLCDKEPERFPSVEAGKLIFLDALNGEMAMLPKLDRSGFFPVGRKTSTLGKSQFSDLLELVYKYAAERGIVLPDVRDYEAG